MAFSSDQSYITTQYGQDNSFSMLYNLYAHKLLQLNIIPETVSEMIYFFDVLIKRLSISGLCNPDSFL